MKKLLTVILVVIIAVGAIFFAKSALDRFSPKEPQINAYVTVSASSVFENRDKLDAEKIAAVPEGGKILSDYKISINEGGSALDALKKALAENKIAIDFSSSPTGAYIKSISSLAEFDAGGMSGWLYKVNGQFAEVSCSDFKISEGDKIEFIYSCDMSADLGF